MNDSLNLWLIRIYSIIILVVALFDILENGAFRIVLGLASIAIIIQSFIRSNKKLNK